MGPFLVSREKMIRAGSRGGGAVGWRKLKLVVGRAGFGNGCRHRYNMLLCKFLYW